MIVETLEAQARAQLPADAGIGARASAAAERGGQPIEVVCRVDRHGQRVRNHFVAGARMARQTLLMLLCGESACPQAQQVQRRWREFNGRPDRPATKRVTALRVLPLMEEVPVEVSHHRCVARPATFECLTPCPTGAHAPQMLRKAGWDLFEDGVWIAGGVTTDRATGATVPRFGHPDEAAAWLAAQQRAARRLMAALR
jgi:hypothetical protein